MLKISSLEALAFPLIIRRAALGRNLDPLWNISTSEGIFLDQFSDVGSEPVFGRQLELDKASRK